jgi:hypothetical protein
VVSGYWPLFARYGPLAIRYALVYILAAALMAKPARQAAQSGCPVGGDHGAYYGAAETAAWLRGHAGANVTLHQRWLGAHWRYYLFDFPYDLRYWELAEALATQAGKTAGAQYIAFPPWQSGTEAELALADVGLSLLPVFRTYQSTGAPGIFLYKITTNDNW